MNPNQTQGYWTEGKVVNGTNIGGGVFVPNRTPVAPAPTVPNAPTNPAPVISTPSRTPGLLEQAKADAAAAAASRASARQEADLYASRQRQARIDAINTTFAPRLKREEDAGEARMSKVAALNLKSGIIGSGVDTTKTGDQKNLNEKSLQALEDEKAAAINEVFGWADELARTRAEDIYKEKTEGANANVAKYQDQATQALEALKTLGISNITAASLKSVDPKVYETLRDVSGMSDAQIDAYLKVNAPEGTYQWNAAQLNGNKMVVPKILNGKVSMESLDLGFTPAKELQTTVKTDNGVYLIYKDGSTSLIGGSTGGSNLKAGAPTWEAYLDAAERAAKMNFGLEAVNKLREQYDKQFVLQDNSDFSSTEKKKLEQAGLLNAPRQEQLDHLYGEDDTTIDFSQAE